MESTYNDEQRVAYLSSGQVIHAFHKSTHCLGQVCPVHKPSEHSFRKYPLFYVPTIGSFFREISDTEWCVDPDDYAMTMRGSVVIENSVECHKCKEKIISAHKHDFVTCSCGETSVDGGSAYFRRVGNDFRDTSIVAFPVMPVYSGDIKKKLNTKK